MATATAPTAAPTAPRVSVVDLADTHGPDPASRYAPVQGARLDYVPPRPAVLHGERWCVCVCVFDRPKSASTWGAWFFSLRWFAADTSAFFRPTPTPSDPTPPPPCHPGPFTLTEHPAPPIESAAAGAIAAALPHTAGVPAVRLTPAPRPPPSLDDGATPPRPLRIAVVLSGGQAPGGHTVITSLFDALAVTHPGSRLFGFIGGPGGIVRGRVAELTAAALLAFRHQGGFHLLGSGRDKIESAADLAAATATVTALRLDGLAVIGGDDSATNAAFLAEAFAAAQCRCAVVAVPKTIDGDLAHPGAVPTSFGFDTACKVCAELVGNIALDAASAGKYVHCIRVMGRAASHVALEVALATRPNVALIAEDVNARGLTLDAVVDEVADVLVARAAAGKRHAVVVLPEGLVESIADVGALVAELNELDAAATAAPAAAAAGGGACDRGAGSAPWFGDCDAATSAVADSLSPASAAVWRLIPPTLRGELMLDRDPHGNVQVSRIETERLLAGLVTARVAARGAPPPSILTHFMGYEARASLPSNFDVAYCAALGAGAAALLAAGRTGLIVSITRLHRRTAEWGVGGHPISSLMCVERRRGRDRVVVRKTLVDLDGAPFRAFAAARARWAVGDEYVSPGPIQFSGVGARSATTTLALALNGGEPIVTH